MRKALPARPDRSVPKPKSAASSEALPALPRLTLRDTLVAKFELQHRVDFPICGALQREMWSFSRQQHGMAKMGGVQHEPAGEPYEFACKIVDFPHRPVRVTLGADARCDLGRDRFFLVVAQFLYDDQVDIGIDPASKVAVTRLRSLPPD